MSHLHKIHKIEYWVPRRAGFCTDGSSIFRGCVYLNKDLATKFDCGYGYYELNITCTTMWSDNDAEISSCEYRGYSIVNACDEIKRGDTYPVKYKYARKRVGTQRSIPFDANAADNARVVLIVKSQDGDADPEQAWADIETIFGDKFNITKLDLKGRSYGYNAN